MKLRLPTVWPSCTLIALALLAHALTIAVIEMAFTVFGDRPKSDVDAILRSVPPVALLAFAMFQGCMRVRRFHPALQDAYRYWLQQTPWNSQMPLPFGPIHLVLADALLLGALSLAALPFHGVSMSLAVIQTFGFAYLILHFSVMVRSGQWYAAYVIWFGVFGMWYCIQSLMPFTIFALIAYAASMVGTRCVLKVYSDWRQGDDTPFSLPLMVMVLLRARYQLAWPYSYLPPVAALQRALPYRHCVLIALSGGWSAYVAVSRFPSDDDRLQRMELFECVALPICALIYLKAYRILEFRPSLEFVGRLTTGRWILPSYDRVFVAPLAAIIVGFAGMPVLSRWGIAVSVAIAITVTSALLILLGLGPERQHWLLTAKCHIVPWNSRTAGDKEWV